MQIKNQKPAFSIISLSIALLFSIALISCTKSNQLASLEERTVTPGNDPENEKGASTYNSQQTWLMDETVWIPCANNGDGEYAKLYGYVHFTNHNIVNNNHFTLVTHTNPNEVSGVGLTTGDKYVASGGGEQVYTGSFINGQNIAIGTTRIRYVGSGPGNNLTIVFKAHVIVNANGEVSNQLLEIERTCE